MKKISIVLALLLGACSSASENEPVPAPQTVTEHSKGYYCTMNLAEHTGPKGQVFLRSKPSEPVWFSTVNQVFAFTRHPGEPKDISAIYVTDWANPEGGKWIDAKTAFYVIESPFIGGMGSVDALPFADEAQANNYAKQNGGRVVGFEQMPDEFIYQ